MEKRYITANEAISLLPKGNSIHTFYNESWGLVGADWSREEVIDKLKKSEKIELTGETARNMSHGIAAYNNDTKYRDEILFIETDEEKLNTFDPIEEAPSEQEIEEAPSEQEIRKAVDTWLNYEDSDRYDEDKARGVIAARLTIKQALKDGYHLIKLRTAKWEETPDLYPVCGNCKTEITGQGSVRGHMTPFCPYCGCKMDYEEKGAI